MASKTDSLIGSLWKLQTKREKQTTLKKSTSTVFKQSSSNFHDFYIYKEYLFQNGDFLKRDSLKKCEFVLT